MKFQLLLVAAFAALALSAPVADYEMDPECLEEPADVEPIIGFEPAYEDEGDLVMNILGQGDDYEIADDDCEDEFVPEPEPVEVEPAFHATDAPFFDEECATDEAEVIAPAFDSEDESVYFAPPMEVAEEIPDVDCEGDDLIEAEPVYNANGRADNGFEFEFAYEEQASIVQPIGEEAAVGDLEECEEY